LAFVPDSLIGMILDINEKTCSVNVNLDLTDLKIWEELTLREVGKHTYFTLTCYIMSKQKKYCFQIFKGYEDTTKILFKCCLWLLMESYPKVLNTE